VNTEDFLRLWFLAQGLQVNMNKMQGLFSKLAWPKGYGETPTVRSLIDAPDWIFYSPKRYAPWATGSRSDGPDQSRAHKPCRPYDWQLMVRIQIIWKGICLLILAVPQPIHAPEPFFYLPTQTELRPHKPEGRRHKERRTSDSGSRFEAQIGLTRHKNDGDY
jgi:hypothetical protein